MVLMDQKTVLLPHSGQQMEQPAATILRHIPRHMKQVPPHCHTVS